MDSKVHKNRTGTLQNVSLVNMDSKFITKAAVRINVSLL